MILLDNNLLYVATPKTATQSVKSAIIDANIPFQEFLTKLKPTEKHYHVPLSQMFDKWGVKESFSVERDWFARWLSGFTYLFAGYLNFPHLHAKFTLEEVTNDFIYKHFDSNFINSIYSPDENEFTSVQERFIYNTEDLEHPSRVKVLCSPNYWKSGRRCTYEFNINELDKLEDFLSDRYKVKIFIPKFNVTEGHIRFPNLVINEELRSFVHDKFEKGFISKVL